LGNAQVARRKYAQVAWANVLKHQDLQVWFEKRKDAFQLVGNVGESHRIFVVSSDTLGKEGTEP